MERIAWVTDSTACLDEELLGNENIYVVPIMVVINGKEYQDGREIQPETLYRIMQEEKLAPTTSQPSVGTFYELFRKLEKNYDRIIAVHLSSKLSGTVSACLQAGQLVGIPVDVFDSLLVSYPMLMILKRLIHYTACGVSVEEAFIKAREYAVRHKTFVLIGSLDQLHRSGRLSGAQYFLGSLMSLKPVISLEEGQLVTKFKARNYKKAEELIFNEVRKSFHTGKVQECSILFAGRDDLTAKWKTAILAEFPDVSVHISPLGSAIGVHTGENTIGIHWFYNE